MIYFFRGLTLFSILNVIPLILFGGSGGMIPVWLVLALAACILSFRRCYEILFNHRWVKVLFSIGVICFGVVETMIIVGGLPMNNRAQSDYIIVLGAHVKGNSPSATLQYRLDAAYEYLMTHPKSKAVLSGGQGDDEIMTEAEAMYNDLVARGIDKERLLLEDKSHTTRENLINSFAIIDAENQEATISVVSNSFHILRAKMQAKELGKTVGGISAKNYPLLIPNYYVREFFAVVKEIFIYIKIMI